MGVAQQRMTVYAALCPHVNVFFCRWSSRSHCQFIWHGFNASPLNPTESRHVSCVSLTSWQGKSELFEVRQLHLKYWAETTFLDTKFVLLCLDDSFTLRHSLPKMPQNQSKLWITKLYIGCFVPQLFKMNKQVNKYKYTYWEILAKYFLVY